MNDPVEILLVEDNPHDLKLTLNAFARHNLTHRIHVARDGEEALDFIFGREPPADCDIAIQPKLILLDLKLPKVDGLEVLRQLKADPRTQLIPVVILTSSKEERDLGQGYRLGVNSYIVKPVDFDDFIEVARSLGIYWLKLNQPPTLASLIPPAS